MNLFTNVTRVSAKYCFLYNNMVVYVIPGFAIDKAIGKDNSNLKRLSDIIAKRIRVLAEPKDDQDLEKFVSVLVYPAKFERIEIVSGEKGKEIIINTNDRESKAMMIGRDRAREKELREILEQYFKAKNVRIN
jgi:NusA-like KH domain protein